MIEWPRMQFLEPLFAVIGAVGMRLYAPERATRDLDIIVALADAEEAERRLLAAGWERAAALSVGGSSWRSSAGEDLDVLFGREPWWPEIIREASNTRDAQGLPVAALRAQVYLKLSAGRTVDAGDLSRLLGLATQAQIEEVRAFLTEYLEQRDLQDFDSLVQLGRLEFGESASDA
ncbi:MAG TPA: hypothetical protein VIR57_04190 [Chloroflexota bacterium]